MNGIKVIMIAAEVSCLLCLGIFVFKRAASGVFDYCDAGVVSVFACCAIIFQSIQQDIQWEWGHDNES